MFVNNTGTTETNQSVIAHFTEIFGMNSRRQCAHRMTKAFMLYNVVMTNIK